jgi:hypothetical protein
MPIFFKLQRMRTETAEEADVEGLRRRCVRSSERATWRNGHRERTRTAGVAAAAHFHGCGGAATSSCSCRHGRSRRK